MPQDHRATFVASPVQSDIIPRVKPQQILWIGCSDSSYQETNVLDLPPDEMMVHRNIGNMIIDGDMSVETTVKHAVTNLKVNHIVVCGHYGCGIVRATTREGLQGPWLSKLDSLHSKHQHNIGDLPAPQRDRVFVELNVLDQLRALKRFPEIATAMKTQALKLHAFVFDRNTGEASRLIETY
ncbi:carbonic anhydrase [Penicillium chermesinum]|uniref:Carbonic anhydrase n=1 Tax=Penicillium chermesinum TaxID=63820 RepID=A0A9W9PJ29_9EURO|nr:carbonic anhydrase [Penicillium chermesinum]KAJ5246851.1 carbonic anhydrase [Penicillium chermesinum]KAJ6145111.1 carbonic anhydrase [Penicillium chermesinum]